MWASGGRAEARAGERGSATIYVLALVLLLVTVAAGAGGIGRLVAAKHRAAAAADLSALSGARVLADGASPTPCAMSATVARRNGGSMLQCTHDGSRVSVTVGVRAALPFGYVPTVRERSRAGPAP